MVEDGIVTQQALGRTVSFATFTAPGEKAHSRWGLTGRSTGLPCHCHEGLVASGVAAWNVSAGHRWNVLMTALRREYPDAQYLRAVEPQTRGALHLHVMVATWGPLDPATVQRLALRSGFGCVVDVQPVRLADDEGGARAVAYYLSKYVTKAADGRDLTAWETAHPATGEIVPTKARYRTWSSSRGWGVQMRTVMSAIRDSSRLAAARMAAQDQDDPLPTPGQTSLVLQTSGAPPP